MLVCLPSLNNIADFVKTNKLLADHALDISEQDQLMRGPTEERGQYPGGRVRQQLLVLSLHMHFLHSRHMQVVRAELIRHQYDHDVML